MASQSVATSLQSQEEKRLIFILHRYLPPITLIPRPCSAQAIPGSKAEAARRAPALWAGESREGPILAGQQPTRLVVAASLE